MSRDAFELLALTARYVFAAFMVLIVLRAARGALVDSRRAAKLRRLSPMTGISGELVVLDPLPKLPRGMRFPVIREGVVGSSRRSDVRVRDKSVRGRHLLFQLTEAGLHIRTHAGARLRDSLGEPARELMLADGDSFFVGNVHLLLVLSVPDLPRKPVRTSYAPAPEPEQDDLFDVGDDFEPPRRQPRSEPISPIFETDDDPFDLQRRTDRDSWAQPRKPKKRQFISDDELFGTDGDNF